MINTPCVYALQCTVYNVYMCVRSTVYSVQRIHDVTQRSYQNRVLKQPLNTYILGVARKSQNTVLTPTQVQRLNLQVVVYIPVRFYLHLTNVILLCTECTLYTVLTNNLQILIIFETQLDLVHTYSIYVLENQKDNHFITFKTLLPTQCFLLYAIFRATGGFLVKHLGIFS